MGKILWIMISRRFQGSGVCIAELSRLLFGAALSKAMYILAKSFLTRIASVLFVRVPERLRDMFRAASLVEADLRILCSGDNLEEILHFS